MSKVCLEINYKMKLILTSINCILRSRFIKIFLEMLSPHESMIPVVKIEIAILARTPKICTTSHPKCNSEL